MQQVYIQGGCGSRPFKAHMATSFLGAFNDNLFKTIVSILVLTQFVSQGGGVIYLALTSALFALPYIFFSAAAGFLADRFAKTSVMKALKVVEVFVMLIALLGFALGSVSTVLASVFLMGLHSALYSPAKYGILPEMLADKELAKGNGYIELYTFLAIISGTALAGAVLQIKLSNPALVSFGIACLGVITSLYLGNSKPAAQSRRFSFDPITPNTTRLREIGQRRDLYLCAIGIAYFFFIGTLFQLNILIFAKNVLHVGELATSLLLAALAVGIGTGSVVAGRTAEGRVELGLVPIGGIGLCLFSLALAFVGTNYSLALVFVLLLGLSGGFFIVPVNAYLQANSPSDKLGGYLAASNFLTFCGIVVSALCFWLLLGVLEVTPGHVFALMAMSSFGVAIYLVRLLPEIMVRCLNWLLLHVFYRITKVNQDNVPDNGGALLVSNHLSLIDAQLILASTERPISFLMYRPIFENPFIKPIAKLNGAIPIAGSDGREQIESTLRHAAEIIKNGGLVGIFAEGKISRTGELDQFRNGLETIMKHVDAPIVPVCLKGLWGSIFSHAGGNPIFKIPKRIPYPVTIEFGSPQPRTTSAAELQEIIDGMYRRVGE